MFYREAGQYKTSYVADQQIFPIAQDRWFVLAAIAFGFLVVPFVATDYMFTEILIPFLILSLAAIGLNILVGYCGQVSLGTGAFMAVGAYAASRAQEHGLLIRAMMNDSIGLCPPLIITEAEVDDLFNRLEKALDETETWVKKESLRPAA